jgi:hypothetical protein
MGAPYDVWKSMLDELLALDDGLTDWEVEFVESLSVQRTNWDANGRGPSDRQFETLERIWNERIG